METPKNIKEKYSPQEVDTAVHRLAKQIQHRGLQRATIVAVADGAMIFAVKLGIALYHLGIDCDLKMVQAKSYGDGKEYTKTQIIDTLVDKDGNNSVEGEDIILVDDILDTGGTVGEVYALLQTKNVNSVVVCTLCIREESVNKDFPFDMPLYSFVLKAGEWGVGMGMNSGKFHRFYEGVGTE